MLPLVTLSVLNYLVTYYILADPVPPLPFFTVLASWGGTGMGRSFYGTVYRFAFFPFFFFFFRGEGEGE